MKNTLGLTRRHFIASLSAGAAFGWSRLGLAQSPRRASSERTSSGVSLPLRLHRNESPYGPFPSALEAMRAAQKKAKLYPGAEPAALQEALAKHYQVVPEQVLLGCGSVEILKIATNEFCSPTARPIVAEPTFEAVVAYSPLSHTEPIKIPVTSDYRHDLDKMLAACNQRASLIFFCNPANPTGTLMKKDEVEQFIRRVPESVVVLVDEAYAEYVDRPDFESCLRYVHEGRPNVLVVRTFSKVYGLAGMRIGYAIGPKELIKRMAPHRLWNNTNQVGTAAALASLADQQSVARVRRLNANVRSFLYEELKKMGLGFIPSETNFVTIHVRRPPKQVIEKLQERQVLVGREFPSLPEHVRVTLGTMEEMRYFLKEFRAVLAS